jgi:hypothetical protein
MYVSSIRIDRFRHLVDVRIGPLSAPAASSLVVLAGPNGGGKSSVLELLGYALSNSWGWGFQFRRNFPDSSFEVAFGLSEGDLSVIRNRIADAPGLDSAGVFPNLETDRLYLRGFNLPGGDYAADQGFHDAAHNLVTTCLRERIKALFLQSDRYYPQQSYNRNRYWDKDQRRSADYLRGMSFVYTERQYSEQMEYLVEMAYDYPRALGVQLIESRAGGAADPEPVDPLLEYETLFQRLFPQYTLIHSTRELQDQLRVVLPDGIEVPFSDLSSGEKEVFFLLTFFIRYSVIESMVFIDEPELHLHPELARRLVQLMVGIQPRNQIWLATHNAELIAEAGRDRTYFMTRPTPSAPATLRQAANEPESVELMRTLFGFGGYVGMAHRIVFLEGDSASTDRQAFSQLFPTVGDEIRFVPLNSADNILRINRAALAILGETVGHTEFLLVRDRDYLTPEEVTAYTGTAGGRLFVLARHEIENYLLDFDALSEVLNDATGSSLTPADCARELKDLSRQMAGRVLKGMISARLNRIFQPQDCSIGGFEDGKEWLDASLTWDPAIAAAATTRFEVATAAAVNDVSRRSSPSDVQRIAADAQLEVVTALQGVGWRTLFPGKELLTKYSTSKGLSRGPILQNALIRNLAANRARVDPELTSIIERAVGHAL